MSAKIEWPWHKPHPAEDLDAWAAREVPRFCARLPSGRETLRIHVSGHLMEDGHARELQVSRLGLILETYPGIPGSAQRLWNFRDNTLKDYYNKATGDGSRRRSIPQNPSSPAHRHARVLAAIACRFGMT